MVDHENYARASDDKVLVKFHIRNIAADKIKQTDNKLFKTVLIYLFYKANNVSLK